MSAVIKNETLIGNRYRIGMWVAIAGVGMLFTSLSSAYIVRSGSSNDWVPLGMPRALILSTGLIVLSSVTLEFHRRKQKVESSKSLALLITVVLGVAFLGTQLFAWRQLVRQGIYLVSNPHSSFFYLLSVTHALHLLGGLIGLLFLLLRSRPQLEPAQIARSRAATDAVSIYWHFMDALWIYLLFLLFLWR